MQPLPNEKKLMPRRHTLQYWEWTVPEDNGWRSPVYGVLTVVCWASSLVLECNSSHFLLHWLQAIQPSDSLQGKNFTFGNIELATYKPPFFWISDKWASKCEKTFLPPSSSSAPPTKSSMPPGSPRTWGTRTTSKGSDSTLFLLGRTPILFSTRWWSKRAKSFTTSSWRTSLIPTITLPSKPWWGWDGWPLLFESQVCHENRQWHFCQHGQPYFQTIGNPPPSHEEGILLAMSSMEGPSRDVRSKWYMPRDLYPDLATTRPSAQGPGYIFSADVAELIYKTSLHTRLLHLEDVYVGLCLESWASILSRTMASITGKWPIVCVGTAPSDHPCIRSQRKCTGSGMTCQAETSQMLGFLPM